MNTMTTSSAGDISANVIYAGGFLGYFWFMVLYALRSNWQATGPGRALMYAIGALNIVVLQSTIHQFTGRYEYIWVTRNITGILIFLTAWWLVFVLVKEQEPLSVHTLFVPRESRGRHDKEKRPMTDEIQITPSNQGIPTQVANPARASWRTAVQSLVAFLVAANAALPIAAQVISDNSALGERYLGAHYGEILLVVNGAVLVGSALAKGVARIMAVSKVNTFIERYLPWLAAIKIDK